MQSAFTSQNNTSASTTATEAEIANIREGLKLLFGDSLNLLLAIDTQSNPDGTVEITVKQRHLDFISMIHDNQKLDGSTPELSPEVGEALKKLTKIWSEAPRPRSL